MFKKKSNNPIGLDFSDSSIKIIQLSKRRDGTKIHALGKIALQEGIVENGEIKNAEILSQKINELLAKPDFGSISSTEVIASLPENLSFTRLITIENTPNNIKDVIESELQKYIPYKIEDMYFDFQIISNRKGFTNVLIGATPKIIIDSYIKIFRNAKLSVVALEIESSALSRCLLQEELLSNKAKNNNSYLIIDIGGKKANISVYANKTIIFSLTAPISSIEATKKIAETLEIEEDKAEKAKIICGLDKKSANGVVNEILENDIKKLLDKINKTIKYFNHEFELTPISEIILTGGGANMKKLDEVISKNTGIKTTIGNIFMNINEEYKPFFEEINKDKKTDKSKIDQNTISGYGVAMGAALRNIFLQNS